MKEKLKMKKQKNILKAILPVLGCLAFLPQMQALSPPPDGCYPNFTTAEGCKALQSLTTGVANTAIGWYSLFGTSSGSNNTALGAGALDLNTADNNTAVGVAALLLNTTGTLNTAVGTGALVYNNIDGTGNNGFGDAALLENVHASDNTAIGDGALRNNDVDRNNLANQNTAVGSSALFTNTDGASNTAVGFQALHFNETGSFNTAIGWEALSANTSGGTNVAIGFGAGGLVTTADNVICIGSINGGNVSNSCYIANIYSNIQPIVGTDPDSVTIASSGRLGRGNVSSRRYKHDIKPMEKASEALYSLKPVSFRYNKEYDTTQTLAFGLIAEEVAEVYPDLVGRNPKGEPESVRYEQVNAMLLNEFLKEHRKVDAQDRRLGGQEATIAELKSIIAQQQKAMEAVTAQLKEQAAQIQKVSAQTEISRSAAQVVVTNH